MLHEVGLAADEETVYLALLEVPSATEAELEPHCAGAAAALDGLERKGLVSRLPSGPRRYAAAPPDVALEALVRAREDDLRRSRRAITQLADRYRSTRWASRPEEVVEVVTTREATLQRWEQLQRSARHEVRVFDRPPYVTDPVRNPIEFELLGRGTVYRCVYDRAGFSLSGRPQGVRASVAAGERARVAYSLPAKMAIADDWLGLLPLELAGTAESCLIVHASALLDVLVALFEDVWERAVPIHGDGEIPDPGSQPSPADADLLGLLAAGLTDAAIARHEGIHPRTVQRRVRGLLDQLDAATRFQAGLQAVRRGWL